MKKILVCGSSTYEMTARVNAFPVPYTPIEFEFDGVRSNISGVGINLTKALTKLGDEVVFYSIIGKDLSGSIILAALDAEGIPLSGVLQIVPETAHSCILYNPSGVRKIILDLKNIQETKYPVDSQSPDFDHLDLALLNNINYSRDLFPVLAEKGILSATDVHVINDIEDDYNKEFMAKSNILFLSNEAILGYEKHFMAELVRAYNHQIIVIGMGEQGALLFDRKTGRTSHHPAVYTRPVVNSIGAGDALCSSFLHFYLKEMDSYAAIQNAIVFASWKIGVDGAAMGFVNEESLFAIRKWLTR